MAETSWPTVAGALYTNAAQWEQMSSGFTIDGVIGAPTETSVVYGDSSAGRLVKIRANKLALVRGNGWSSGTSEFTKTIAANTSGSTRIDLVVLRYTRSNRTVTVQVKTGTPGAGAPTLTQDAIGAGSDLWEIPLAQVTVANGVSVIAASAVVSTAKFVRAGIPQSRPVAFRQAAPDHAISAAFSNTSAPSTDSASATGAFTAARLVIDKQSPDTDLEVDIQLTGYCPSAAGRVTVGVRVIATGYTSTNHNVGSHFFNWPLTHTQSLTEVFSSSADVVGGHTAHGHLVGPYQHDHTMRVEHSHMWWGGFLRLPGLAARQYTVQLWFLTQGQQFNLDSNDSLIFKLAEV